MVQSNGVGKIFSATYSNVPVYETNIEGNHVMRRRSDDWINATHILKVAGFDKPARTRILEREVQKGTHEKVQGGYGKYQGTWIPLADGRDLAQRNGVLDKLLPILDYVAGDKSPPQAPKHTTSVSNRPRAPRQNAKRNATAPQFRDDQFEIASSQLNDDDYADNDTIISGSFMDDEGMLPMSQQSTVSRKRKRISNIEALAFIDQQHTLYADELLDYFIVSTDDGKIDPPQPPPNFEVDRAIDDQGHTALHWAAAMGDLDVVKDLLARGANMACQSHNRETPLMRAVLFTNNFEKQTMPRLVALLQSTIDHKDFYGSTVFHHIAATTSSRSKFICARYYIDTVVNQLTEAGIPAPPILNMQDQGGDTALLIAARHGARKCVRALLGHGSASDIPNYEGETAESILRELSQRKDRMPQASSSPFQIDGRNGRDGLIGGSMPLAVRSNAAIAVSQKIAPLILEKAAKLAGAFDKELNDKESSLAEANQILANRKRELVLVQQQNQALAAQDDQDDDDDLNAQRNEVLALIAENQQLLEQSQNADLLHIIHGAAATLPVSAFQDEQQCGGDNDQQKLNEKLHFALALKGAKAQHRALLEEVVQNQSVVGLGERHDDYKRLISQTLGVKEDAIENLMPDIMEELEMATNPNDIAVQ